MTMINVDIVGVLPLKRQLELLNMGTARRRRLLHRVSQKVIRDARKRIRTQTDLSGMAYRPRAKSRKDRRKMLAGLSKRLAVVRNDSLSAEIGFRRGRDAGIAGKQQFGAEVTVASYQLKEKSRTKGTEYYGNPATKKQAKTIKDLGFKPRIKGNKGRPVSMAWITANMTIGQAGAIIQSMRARRGVSAKTSWVTRLPARSFLGATDSEVRDHINTIYETLLGELNRGIG